MATPVGHLLAGYAVFSASANSRPREPLTLLVLCLGMAMAADFDFLPGILAGQPIRYHQGLTHSFSVAVIFSLIVALIYTETRKTLLADWGRLCVAYTSHLAIDWCGTDTRPPYGIPLFWPFSNRTYLSPWAIFPGVSHGADKASPTAEWISTLLQPTNLAAIGIEVLVLLPVMLLVRYGCQALWRARHTKGR